MLTFSNVRNHVLFTGSIIDFVKDCVRGWWEKIITLNSQQRAISIPEAFTLTQPSASFRLLLCPFILILHACTHTLRDAHARTLDTCVCKRMEECEGNLKLYHTVDEAFRARRGELVFLGRKQSCLQLRADRQSQRCYDAVCPNALVCLCVSGRLGFIIISLHFTKHNLLFRASECSISVQLPKHLLNCSKIYRCPFPSLMEGRNRTDIYSLDADGLF